VIGGWREWRVAHRSVSVELGLCSIDFGVDGTQQGYLSEDGNVLLLPQCEAEDESRSLSLDLREP
jgi:hypothetical protein